MKHDEYRKLLRDLKNSGWILLGEVIIAIGFVLLMVLSFKK